MRGSTEPRVYTPPLRELTPETSLGYQFIDFCGQVLDIRLLPWQKWLAVHAMEIEGDLETGWMFRFRTVLSIMARQQGKTFFIAPLSAYHMHALGDRLVIGTAQDLATAEEAWEGAVELNEANQQLRGAIRKITRGNGAKLLELKGGERYRTVSASRKGARGKRCDLVIMDELREQQSWDGWSAISKTMMARPNAQLWAFSNAGDGTSVVLNHLRRMGHERAGDPDGIATVEGQLPGEDVDDSALFIAEWSAEPGADLESKEGFERAVAQANPSLGYGFVTMRALKSAFATDPPDVFKTECLCQWVQAKTVQPFPEGAWEAGEDEKSEVAPDSRLVYGVDVCGDRSASSIAVCGLRPDRQQHVEVVAYQTGSAWVVKWIQARADLRNPIKVALQGRGAPVSALADILAAIDGVEVVECAGRDVAAWCGGFYDAVTANVGGGDATPVRHRPQPVLDLAATVAQTHPLGDSAWAFDRAKSEADISPLIACVMAHGAFNRVEQAPAQSAYEAGGILFV